MPAIQDKYLALFFSLILVALYAFVINDEFIKNLLLTSAGVFFGLVRASGQQAVEVKSMGDTNINPTSR